MDVSLLSLSSAFSITAEQSISNGNIRITQGSIQPIQGDVLLATLQISAKSEGIGKIPFISGSAVTRSSDSSDSFSSSRSIGGYYTLIAQKQSETKIPEH